MQNSTINVFSLPYDFLNNIFFSVADSIVKIQYIIYITYKIGVNQLIMLLVRLPVNKRLLLVKFWGSQKLYINFQLHKGGVSAPNPCVA